MPSDKPFPALPPGWSYQLSRKKNQYYFYPDGNEREYIWMHPTTHEAYVDVQRPSTLSFPENCFSNVSSPVSHPNSSLHQGIILQDGVPVRLHGGIGFTKSMDMLSSTKPQELQQPQEMQSRSMGALESFDDWIRNPTPQVHISPFKELSQRHA
jgi:hypothetical protein